MHFFANPEEEDSIRGSENEATFDVEVRNNNEIVDYSNNGLNKDKGKDNKRVKLVAVLLNLLSVYLNYSAINKYILSLEGCTGTQIDCLNKWKITKFYQLGFLVVDASVYSSIILVFFFWRLISVYNIIYPIITYYVFFLMDHGTDLDSHGQYNFYLFLSLTAVFFLVFLFFSG